MFKSKFLIFLELSLALFLPNIKTNCTDMNTIKEFVQTKPLYTSLIVYTACWAPKNIDDYSKKYFSNLVTWIGYLIIMGYSKDDASLLAPLMLMPGKGLLEKAI